jgi:hypothetical protein
MEFFLPEDNLTRATPAETKITSLAAEPYPDGRRLHVNIEMTPFQTRPYLEVTLHNARGDEVAAASFIEPMSWKLEFTLHLRGDFASPYRLEARLFYPDGPSDELRTLSVDVTPPSAD